jgi:hypothetical protein
VVFRPKHLQSVHKNLKQGQSHALAGAAPTEACLRAGRLSGAIGAPSDISSRRCEFTPAGMLGQK